MIMLPREGKDMERAFSALACVHFCKQTHWEACELPGSILQELSGLKVLKRFLLLPALFPAELVARDPLSY